MGQNKKKRKQRPISKDKLNINISKVQYSGTKCVIQGVYVAKIYAQNEQRQVTFELIGSAPDTSRNFTVTLVERTMSEVNNPFLLLLMRVQRHLNKDY